MPRTEEETSFLRFARALEPGLKAALMSYHGSGTGPEATNDALLYGWRHWSRVRRMSNPAGYLYRVGQRSARRRRKRPLPDPVSTPRTPWVEPGLLSALEALTVRQRQVVVLVEAYEWTQREVADLLGIKVSSVQTHLGRAIAYLSAELGVEHE